MVPPKNSNTPVEMTNIKMILFFFYIIFYARASQFLPSKKNDLFRKNTKSPAKEHNFKTTLCGGVLENQK